MLYNAFLELALGGSLDISDEVGEAEVLCST